MSFVRVMLSYASCSNFSEIASVSAHSCSSSSMSERAWRCTPM